MQDNLSTPEININLFIKTLIFLKPQIVKYQFKKVYMRKIQSKKPVKICTNWKLARNPILSNSHFL